MSQPQKMFFLACLLGLNLIVWSSLVEASDWRAGLLIGSEHWDDQEWNEDQNGFYGCYKAVCAGQYENSYSEIEGNPKLDSEFLMVDHHLFDWGVAEFRAGGGIVNGYKGHNSSHEWTPFATVTMQVSLVKIWQFGKVTAYGLELGGGYDR
jgi:hypothetical protein